MSAEESVQLEEVLSLDDEVALSETSVPRTDVMVAELEPARASTALRLLTAQFPLHPIGLGHLKRIRKPYAAGESARDDEASADGAKRDTTKRARRAGAGSLEIVLAPASSWNALAPSERDELKEIVGLARSPRVAAVPARAPGSRAQFEEARALWPITFNPTDVNTMVRTPDVDEASRRVMAVGLEAAHADARAVREIRRDQAACGHGCVGAEGAVVVDPSSGAVVATSADALRARFGAAGATAVLAHPLLHAPLLCVGAVAELHRQRGSARAHPVTEPDAASGARNDAELGAAATSASSKAEGELDEAAGYLCTGLDLYATHEPCAMCAMVSRHPTPDEPVRLTHSRIPALARPPPSPPPPRDLERRSSTPESAASCTSRATATTARWVQRCAFTRSDLSIIAFGCFA